MGYVISIVEKVKPSLFHNIIDCILDHLEIARYILNINVVQRVVGRLKNNLKLI